ncbi:MAG: hypothetical protein LBG06_09170 [Deltaproteobacteria bacterium]|jgi:hypothetical protein|nr:hypothetical protein [Deltaproteobacteria bacterium]
MAESKVQEGIYLQTKKSTIGTGNTAKDTEYRNFWATLSVGETHVEMILLDDAFMLTGIRERFPVEDITESPNWLFVEQGAKKYSQLRPRLDNILSPPPKAPAPRKTGAPKPGSFSAPKAGAPAARKPPGRSQSPVGRKDGWWNR